MDADVIKKLKYKAIDEYILFLNKLYKGYKLDYYKIKDIICLIDLYENFKYTNNYLANKLLR